MDDKRITRRKFVAVIATGTAALALPGCSCDGTHGEGPDGGTPDGGRPAAIGTLKYVRYYESNVGAPAGTYCSMGKHVQGCVDEESGELLLYGGDGDWRLADTVPPFTQCQGLQSVLAYDFSEAAQGRMEQRTKTSGDPADGTAPNSHDGATWVYNSQEKAAYGIPGFQRGSGSSGGEQDIYGIKVMSVVHKYDARTHKWIQGPSTIGNWAPEHWGGCYDSKRNRIWVQWAGILKWFDCTPQTWGLVGLAFTPNIARYEGLGYALTADPWCQRYNPVTDELICFDGYRGHIMAIPLSDQPVAPTPRIVVNVPALIAHPGDGIGTVEIGVCISAKRQKAFISYAAQNYYVVGGVGGVWAVDLATGATQHADYPAEAGGPDNCMYSAAEYIDKHDCLILWNNIVDASRVWDHRFLRYEFKD